MNLTASEPNLLKMRLKQRVLERRSSPLSRRRERSSHPKRRSCLASMDIIYEIVFTFWHFVAFQAFLCAFSSNTADFLLSTEKAV